MFDVEAGINSLKWKSGAGPDQLSPYVIKMCTSTVVWPIWLLFQKSFDVGKIPDTLELSRIVPIYKRKGEKSNVTNYRVIAIASVVLKIHEIAVKRKMSERIQRQLSNAQHGFRNQRSVVTNLLSLSILANSAFERSAQLDVFYGDFKTAFDTVWIRKLIEKLAKFNIGKKTAKWICEFLIGRRNIVQIEKCKSKVYNSASGVPPGSSLGPLLFNIFIDDVTDTIENGITLLFADDIKLAKIIYDQIDGLRMQRDINNLVKWCKNNRLYFNEDKCSVFSAFRNNTSFVDITYTLDHHIIKRVDEVRDLGVLIDRYFYFGHHIEQITMKCRQLIGCIKHHSNGNFTLETQRILYLAYVRSRLEFASVIWNPSSAIYRDDIESIQKQFVLYLLDSRRNSTSYRLAPYDDRCKQVKLQRLDTRRTVADAVLAYNIYTHNINEDLISSKFIVNQSIYDLRDSTMNLLVEPRYSSHYLSHQPIARLIRLINKYKTVVSSCDNRFTFKLKIIDELNKTENTNII